MLFRCECQLVVFPQTRLKFKPLTCIIQCQLLNSFISIFKRTVYSNVLFLCVALRQSGYSTLVSQLLATLFPCANATVSSPMSVQSHLCQWKCMLSWREGAWQTFVYPPTGVRHSYQSLPWPTSHSGFWEILHWNNRCNQTFSCTGNRYWVSLSLSLDIISVADYV